MKDAKENIFKGLETEFEIFANWRRLAVLSFLKTKKSGSVGEIADGTSLSFKTVSRHLLYLAKEGILERRYDGPFVIYKISANLPKTARLIISSLL